MSSNLTNLFFPSHTNSTNSTALKPAGSNSNNSKKSNAGAIAGGVIGTIGFIAILAGVAFCFLRRRRRQNWQSHQAVELGHHEERKIDSGSNLIDSNELYEAQGSAPPYTLYPKYETVASNVELPGSHGDTPERDRVQENRPLVELDASENKPSI